MTSRRTILDDMQDADRKKVLLAAVFDYFPNALIEIALVIYDGQVQHKTTGWDRTKSNDHRNTLLRHYLQAGTVDTDGRPHSAKVAVRALMALELESEARLAAQTARNGRERGAGGRKGSKTARTTRRGKRP